MGTPLPLSFDYAFAEKNPGQQLQEKLGQVMVIPVPLDELGDAGVDGGGGVKTELGLGPADVGKGGGDVAWLDGQEVLLGGDAQFLFQQGDDLGEVLGAVVADVEDLVRVKPRNQQ